MEQQHHLAAILFTDIVGSTSIMQEDELAAIRISRRYLTVLKQSVSEHGGQLLNDYGDGSLCCFASAIQAVKCAMEVQQQLQMEPKVPLRIGLHVGEIFLEDGKAFGDGVNVAARIQSLGVANSILFSSEINSKLTNHTEFVTKSVGTFRFKNVNQALEVFALLNEGLVVPNRKKMEGKLQNKTFGNIRMILAAVVLIIGLISFLAYRQYTTRPRFTGKEKSIAVLPFDMISAESGNEYISDGFTGAVIDKLSKLSWITEIPGWARVKPYKNTKENILDIANSLGVAAILTATIQKQADRLRIIADLTDVNTGKTIWHSDNEGKYGDVLSLENEVAERIAQSLSAKLTLADQNDLRKQYTENPEAYRYYSKGRYFWDNRTPVSFDSAEANYLKAIEIDPNYALAYAGLGDLYIINQKGLTQLEAIPKAVGYVNKALMLDSTLVQSITTLGFIQLNYYYDVQKAKQSYEKAIKLDPSYVYAHIHYGTFLVLTGEDPKRGIEEIKKARDLDPTSRQIDWILGRNYYYAGQYEFAEEQLRKAVIMNPTQSPAKHFLGLALIAKKAFGEAIDIIKQIPKNGISRIEFYQGPLLSYAYSAAGNFSQAKAVLDSCLEEHPIKSHYGLAMAYTGLKEYAFALNELDKSLGEKEIFMMAVKMDPIFMPLRSEPRFQMLLKQMNLE
jgi:adenylate cyclase